MGTESAVGRVGTASGMTIGEIARRAGIRPSAIRYYEGLGLLPAPRRRGGQRRYDAEVLDRLGLVALAREAGFTIAEIRELVREGAPGSRAAARWRELAARKLAELDELASRTERMRAVLRRAISCGCLDLADCAPLLRSDGTGPCA